MKQLVLLLLSCFLAFNVHSQDIHFPSLNFVEPGKVYALCTSSVSSNIQEDKAQILKVVFPKWKEKSDTVFKVLPYKNVKTKDATLSIKFGTLERGYIGQEPTNCIGIAILEIPQQHYNTAFIEGNFKIIKVQQLVRSASVELVDAEQVKIEPQFVKLGLGESDITYFRDNENDIVYAKLTSGLSWGEDWQQYYCIGGGSAGLSLRDVCKALKEKGYYSEPEINNMTPSLKDALLGFQKDNGLPVGSLDFETVKALFPPPLAVWSEEEKLIYTLNGEKPPKYRRNNLW